MERRDCCGGERGKVHKDGCEWAEAHRPTGARTESDLKPKPPFQWFYAFSARPNNPWPVYERTFGSEEAADRWVEESPSDRFITVGMVPEKYWY